MACPCPTAFASPGMQHALLGMSCKRVLCTCTWHPNSPICAWNPTLIPAGAAGLEPRHQDALARFVAAVAPSGAAEAVQLPGLSLKAEVDLARQAGQLRCGPALVQSCLE